jgi:hypothetical protein
VNEAGIFTLRGKQEGVGKRGKRITTTTTTTTRTTTLTSTTSIPAGAAATLRHATEGDDVVEPAALLAFEEAAWKTESSNASVDAISLSAFSTQTPVELVVKPLTKVVLPCDLEGNYTRLLMPAVRYVLVCILSSSFAS